MIKIYDINDKLLMQAEVTSAAKREQEMSKSDYISLSFSAAEKVILPVGAYINYTYKIDKVREVTRKFLLLESYEPTQSDECSWKYTPQFQHPKMILSKTPFFIYTRNSQNVEVKQNVWSFVGTTSVLSGKIANFLNKDLMFGECGWKVIFSNVTANTVNVSFSDNDFISALTAITNAIGDNCEWHIDYDDEIIYIGKVLIGATPVILEVGKNVGVPNISNSKESYYNAFSIFGGTRNITQVNSKGENVSSGDIRLQLDEGNGTISIDGKERSYSIDKYSTLDLRADKTKEPLFTKVLDFSQIFPSLNTYVYNVRGRVKYVLDENNEKIPILYNADGSIKEYKTFTVWYMRLAYPTTERVEGKTIINTTVDDGVTHYWYDFEITDDLLINGKNIGCSFEPNFNTGALSTPLAGRGSNGEYVGFELTYHKDASSSHTSDDVSDSNFSVLAGDYEIIYQEDNEVIIPTNAADMLIPRGESKPSLKCNIIVLYNIAMSDTIYYEDAQNRLLEKAKEEIVRLLSDLNNYEVKSYSDVFLEDNPQLQIGQSVTYKDGHGYELASRVLKLSTNIDYDFIQSITIGNQVIKGTITQLKEDVQTIIASGGSIGSGGGYSVSQLRSLIAKYGSDNFISKQFDDIAHGTITFEKVQKFLSGFLVGENFSFDKEGNIIAHSIASENANTDEEKGFSIAVKDKETGKYKLCVDELLAWGLATVKQLHVKGDSTFDGNLLSKQFISDFLTGKGWGIYNKPIINADGVQENKWTGEFDNVIVRGSLRVYEMIISQLLGENDNRVFAGMMEVDHYDAESGKVYLNTQDGKIYNPFRRDDIIMVQQYNGEPSDGKNYYITKGYELIVTEVGSEGTGKDMLAWVKFKNFTCSMEDGTPEQLITQRDTFVRVDNISDPDRKGIMQIITVGTASPHLDVIYGLKTDPEGALKGRLGNLEGIVHPWFGRLQGFGEYLNNLYAVGDLIMRRTGESVDTKLQVLENMFSTRFAKTSYELTNGQNYLENGQFLDQINDAETPIIDSWEINTDDETMFWVDENGMPFMVNSMLTTSGNKKVTMEQNDGRQMLRIQNCGLRQKNAIIKKPGTHKEYQQPDGSVGDNGLKNTTTENVDVQDKLYVNVRIYAKTAGQLTYGFEDCTAVDGKENTLTAKTENIAYSGEWQTVMMDGNWNGTGDFVIRYSGDCYIALVAITDEPLSDLRKTVSTQIMQTAENIKLLGENIDNVNGTTTQLGIELNAAKENISLYVKKTDKNTSDISQMKIKVGSIEQTVGQAATQEQLNENVKALNKSISSNLDAAKNYANDVGEGIRNDYSSTITTVQQKSNSWSVAAAGFDENGKIKASAGAVLKADFAGLFASQVDEKGLVSTGQMNIAISNGISSATIQADHINLTGHTMAFTGGQITINTDNFKLDKSGSVSMNGKITATSGQIAGMKISGLSLTNEELNNDACIILRNNNRNTYAAIGGNVVAPETGMRAVASFTNGEKKPKYATNSAMIVGASGAGTNIAIDITGGYINGLRIRTEYLTAGGEHIYNPVKIPKGVNSVILAGAGYYELPAMDQNDDGYVIFVKNDYDGSVNISASTGVTVDGSSKNTFILYDKGNQSTDLTISYRGYAMFFVYHRDVSRADISAQSGCWVQYKCPRSW